MKKKKRESSFLSYASEDLAQVKKVYEGLTNREINIWFDKVDLKPGDWKPQIERAISKSRYFVICISNIALKKMEEPTGFQIDEFEFAYSLADKHPASSFTIVPVGLEDYGRENDLRISRFARYDLFPDFENGLDKLAINIRGSSLANANAKDERADIEKLIAGLMAKGELYYYHGEYDKAICMCEASINIKPDCYEAWYNKGVSIGLLGRHAEAIEAYKKATEIKPNSHNPWYNKGISLYKFRTPDIGEKNVDNSRKHLTFRN